MARVPELWARAVLSCAQSVVVGMSLRRTCPPPPTQNFRRRLGCRSVRCATTPRPAGCLADGREEGR